VFYNTLRLTQIDENKAREKEREKERERERDVGGNERVI